MAKLTLTEFKIGIPQNEIDDLKRRLKDARMPQDLSFGDGKRGIDIAIVQEVADAWANGFDWRAEETFWNAYPQYMTVVDGQPIHFLHIRSKYQDATPLVLLHGFPGSFVEFRHVIEPLTDPEAHGGSAEDAFHLVIPSLPGFAFSTPLAGEGWGGKKTPKAIADIMTELGYDKFGAQGGDYGAWVGPDLGRMIPERMIGVHVNAASVGFIPVEPVEGTDFESLSTVEKKRVERLGWYMSDGNWYFDIQAKRPQTLAYGLSDSPTGQLAWILNLFKDFSANLPFITTTKQGMEDFLTNLSLYWFYNSSAPAANLYFEAMHGGEQPTPQNAPTGVAAFGHDVSIRRYAEQMNTNIVHWSDIDAGGHFAALEVPELLVEDVRAFFRTVRNR